MAVKRQRCYWALTKSSSLSRLPRILVSSSENEQEATPTETSQK